MKARTLQKLQKLSPAFLSRSNLAGCHRKGVTPNYVPGRDTLYLDIDKIRLALGVVERPLQKLGAYGL